MTHKITVVGGGTAGVMAATYLKSYYGELVDVTMIYDHSKPGIGVGESMTPKFDNYLKAVGISTVELVQNCNATIKLALQFKDWTYEGSLGYHSFPINEAIQSVDPTLAYYNAVDAYDMLTNQFEGSYNYDKFYFDNNLIFGTDNTSYRHAMHIDANLVGRYIESKFKDRINIVNGIVQQVNVKDKRIESIVLESGETYTSDLFIDSSGLAYVLIKHLDPEWVDVQDQLPTNRTIPNPVFKDFDYIPTYTSAKATKNGWILDVPLSNRRGCGYVYSSSFQTDEDAKIEFNKWLVETHNVELTSNRVIKYDNGYWKEQYIGNCMAVGLSAGFVEPLEATSIGTSIQQSFLLMHRLPNYDENTIEKYNKDIGDILINIRDFVILHYITKKDNTDFWRDISKIELPETLKSNLAKWRKNLPIADDFSHQTGYVLFRDAHYLQVLAGLQLFDQAAITEEYNAMSTNSRNIAETFIRETKTFEKINPSVGHKEFILQIRNPTIT